MTACSSIASWLFLIGACAADEWPQFRGPGGQGHAVKCALPVTWSETENVTWRTEIPGRGWSSPLVGGNQIWLTTALDAEKTLHVISVDLASGQITRDVKVFDLPEKATINAKNSFASPTGVLQADRLYVHYGTYGTACIDTNSGKPVWRNTELQLDHKEGPGSSPVLWENLLIVNCDGIDAQYVAALDKLTGKLVWKRDRPGPLAENPDFRKAYCTPLVIEHHGRPQLVSPGADQVIAYDPATGNELWKVRYSGFSNVPRPLFGEGLLFVCTGFMKPQLWAIRPGENGDLSQTNVAWRVTKQVPANPSPVLVEDRIYMVSDQGVLTCLDAKTGNEIWKNRLTGNYSASPIDAGGRVYFFSEEGVTSVIQPGQEFELLAKNQLDGRFMASPAVVGNTLILRTDTHLYRIEDGKSRSADRAARRKA